MLRKYFLNKIFVISGSIVFSLTLFSDFSFAQKLNYNGMKIEILWNQRGRDKIHIWGNVTKGSYCDRLDYRINLSNSSNGITAYVNGFISNYKPNHRTSFFASDRIRKSKNYKGWHLEDYSFICHD